MCPSIPAIIDGMNLPNPITRRAALAAGITDELLAGRKWRRITRGFYVPASDFDALSPTHKHLVLARAVQAATDGVISHVSAAVALGLPVWDLPIGRIHMTRNQSRGSRTRGYVVVHAGPFAPDETATVDGLRVTSGARTVVDIARTAPIGSAVAVGDAALRARLTTRAELDDGLIRAAHRAGTPRARHALELLDGRSESVGETRSRLALVGDGLPTPEPQASVFDDDNRFVARVDLLFADLGVIAEFDRKIKYGKDIRGDKSMDQVLWEEKRREDRLRALGWIVVRITWDELADPPRLRRKIRAAAAAARGVRLGSWQPSPKV